jgi:glycosyltransferase involved in cell wall biosynthesis
MNLLIVGPGCVHISNFLALIQGAAERICIATDDKAFSVPGASVTATGFSLRNPLAARRTVNRLKKIILACKPDIIHVHEAGTHAYLALKAARGKGIPTIVTAWGSDILVVPHFSFLHRRMIRYILRKADFMTSDSVFLARCIRDLSPGKNHDITLVSYGTEVSFDHFEKERIFYSNRLHKKNYRIDAIMEAFARFRENRLHEGWRLVIAGSGPETGRLRRLAGDLGLEKDVEFTGWLGAEQNTAWYRKASCYVSIPDSDATSISLLEAMSAGCVPVVSDLPANREWVIHGKTGVVVSDLSANFLEEALKIDAPAAAMQNRTLLNEKASRKVCRDAFMDLYKKALKA